ncbi:hypothetical protein [Hymenobacter koreensis]|uniref:PH domain-containing protein n=1 Tax=Hymenobacter koreensis TaxID=1084523 RepID=A0ABP8JKW8_9BACT
MGFLLSAILILAVFSLNELVFNIILYVFILASFLFVLLSIVNVVLCIQAGKLIISNEHASFGGLVNAGFDIEKVILLSYIAPINQEMGFYSWGGEIYSTNKEVYYIYNASGDALKKLTEVYAGKVSFRRPRWFEYPFSVFFGMMFNGLIGL